MISIPNLRILIIDDNPAIHTDFIKILSTGRQENNEMEELEKQIFGHEYKEKHSLPQFQLDTASQGQEGVKRIEEAIAENNPYALAFVDIRMPPGWDGIETIKYIWKLDSDIQIVICTAYSDFTWEETVEKLGQRENLLILKKPFDAVAVRQLSCALTKKWQLAHETRDYTASLERGIEERTQSLQESLSVTRGTLESSTDGILVLNTQNIVIDYNQKLIEMWKIPNSLLETKNASLILEYIAENVQDSEEYLKLISNISLQCDTIKIDKWKCKDNRIFEHFSQPYKQKDKIAGRIWSYRDITERALLEEKFQYLATHDSLTGLPNRVVLTDRISQLISVSKRDGHQFAVLFFDLDRFKLINDSLSHAGGDLLLQLVANRLRSSIREADTLARLGGDEFVAVINYVKNEKHLLTIIRKIFNVFIDSFKINDSEIFVNSSMGICLYPRHGNNVEELLRNADMAMYRAKENGGNQFQFYTDDLSKRSVDRFELEKSLRQAIHNEEFFLCYQPQLDLISEKIISAEALIRWKHPNKGIVLPLTFIPLAEETGLINVIGEWVLKTACKQNKLWQDAGLPCIRIAVNVTTHQFQQPNFTNLVSKVLQETQLDPQYLELELTENVIINSISSIETIIKLKELGITIALDDFGTGYSSLNYLAKIPLDRVKIDQSFVQNINLNRGDEVIIQAIIGMAKNLNLKIMAEGVENKKQLDFLRSKRCKEVQGHYFSVPLHSYEMEELLRKNMTISKN